MKNCIKIILLSLLTIKFAYANNYNSESESPFYALDNLIVKYKLKNNIDYKGINTDNLLEYFKDSHLVERLYKSKVDNTMIYTTLDKHEYYSDNGYTEVKVSLNKTNISPTSLPDSGLKLEVMTENSLICKSALTKRRYLHNFKIEINGKEVNLDKINEDVKSQLCDYNDKYFITAYYY